VTNRRKPTQRQTSTDWKPSRPQSELLKAIGAAAAVVVLTVVVIFVIKPDDAATVPSSPAVTTPTVPTGSQDATSTTVAPGTGNLPSESTTLPTASTTTPAP
jgi:hypothetical protein